MTKIVEGTAPKAPIQELVGFEIVAAEEGATKVRVGRGLLERARTTSQGLT